jgi:hypothetical protein
MVYLDLRIGIVQSRDLEAQFSFNGQGTLEDNLLINEA